MALPRSGRIAALLVAMFLATGSVAVADTTSPTAPPSAPTGSTVTLLTGDRVTTYDTATGPRATVKPGYGREGIGFATYRQSGHLYAIPSDAASLVADGKLDKRLFDVTTLLDSGYGDGTSDTLPLLVTQSGGQQMSVPDGATITQALPSIGGSALSATKSTLDGLWNSLTTATGTGRTLSSGTERIWLDGKRSASLDRSAKQIGAPQAWQQDVTGRGVKVAVLDTGVDQTHPDLSDRETAQRNFSDSNNNGDHFGHGTHVAGIIAGTGAFSNGKYRGIAHGANILDGKVLGDSGSGNESDILAGMQWAADQQADIANISLGGGDTPEVDPLEKAVNDLSANTDTLFVVAAGNSGPAEETVGSPGSADAALTVGAVNRKDGLAEFSSRGPRIGDGAIKPDITAPGVGIASALHSDATIGEPVDGRYTRLDGTSMATPHVAGAAALLAQAHPKYTGEQLKATLTASARPNPELSAFEQGSGRVDVPAALAQSVTTGPTNLSFGKQQWPHDDDKPVTKKLTYHNRGDSELTLKLSARAKGPDGQQAPAGMFTVDQPSVTIPAGGSADIRVTANTTVDSPDGTYSGEVLATGDNTRLSTPMAVTKEVESYDLTVNHIGPAGNPVEGAFTQMFSDDLKTKDALSGKGATQTIRLPKGRYHLESLLFTGAQDNPHTFDVIRPSVDLNRNTTVDVDFQQAKPINIKPPKQAGKPLMGVVGYQLTSGTESLSATLLALESSGISTAHLGPALPKDRFTAHVGGEWAGQQGSYHLGWFQPSKFPTGFDRSVQQDELATVQHRIGATGANQGAEFGSFSVDADTDTTGGVASMFKLAAPGTHTAFYNTDGVRWSSMVSETAKDQVQKSLESPPRTYQAGNEHKERYNFAPFGPGFPRSSLSLGWAFRYQNSINAQLPLLTDGDGNAGMPYVGQGRTTLHRDGKLIGSSDTPATGRFTVPADAGRYRLSTEVNRPNGPTLSPRVSASWTFESQRTDAEKKLPLSAVRFNPELDDNNSAPSGQHDEVPVFLQNADGAPAPSAELAVQVSYDGGKNWAPAKLTGNGKVALDYPANGNTVSLRAQATDQSGNTVEQTVINAYKLH